MFHGDTTTPHAQIDKLENGYLVTLIDFPTPEAKPNGATVEGPNGQTFTMVMPEIGGGTFRPRPRKFMARDLEDVGLQLARFFDGSNDRQRSDQTRSQD